MRKYFIIASALLLAACAKEAPVQEETQDRQEPQSEELVTYTISATINATKAYIDDTTVDESGYSPLKWELGDKIALKSGESYTIFEIKEAGDIVGGVTATFKADDVPGKVFTNAYYPYDYRGEDIATYYASTYNNISLANSKKSFAMEATVGEGVSSIEFTQKGSLAKFTVSNVPSFTRKAKLVAGSLTETVAITESEAATGSAVVYFAIPAGTYEMTFSLEDSASTPNTFYSKTRSSAIYASSYEFRYTVALPPVVDITKFATSWGAAYVYLFADDVYYDTEWSNLSSVMKTYNDGTYDHYYRVLPAGALNNTYDVIVFNSSDDTYRIRSKMTIQNQTRYSASQLEGLRLIGDTHDRIIVRDEAMGTNTSNNPDTYFYIKSIDGGHEAATGTWESEGTKALGWFIGKRSGASSGRYYYFDTNEISQYSGKSLTFEYTMYKEGCTGDNDNRWRGSYNNSGYTYSNYLHLGNYFDGDLKWYVDSNFDDQMSE